MDPSPAKRRKTDHSVPGNGYAALPFDAAAASAGLFRPSTFLLETAELLEQSKVDYGELFPDAVEILKKLKTVVEAVGSHEPVPIAKAAAAFEKKHAVKIPFPTPRPAADSLLKLSMATPVHCNVVGSYVSKTMIRSQRTFAVDFIVEMPRSLFQEKDYLNLRYFYKRAYYLAHISAAVSSATNHDGDASLALEHLSFDYLHENPLLPILVARPKVSSGGDASSGSPRAHSELLIRIIPCCPDGLFPQQKLLPNKNCLRPESVSAAPATSTSASSSSSTAPSEPKRLPPTPFYNATLKADAAYLPYLKLLHHAQKTCSAFTDACLLGRVWLQQRGFGGSLARGGFGAFEWAALVALLLQTGSKKKSSTAILSPSLSSVQIFKAVVQFLAATDLLRSKPCILGGPAPESGLDSLREGTMPVLYDAGRQLNLGYKMSPWSAAALRQHAKWTHELLKDESAPDQFTPTFIGRADISLEAFDLVTRIRCPAAAPGVPGPSAKSDDASPDRHGATWDFGHNVFQVLKKAMGDRARLIHVQLPPSSAWPLDQSGPETASAASPKRSSGTEDRFLAVGIVFDPINMARTSDRGPAAEDKKEARKFREFWGERAELRRFKDGSITETLVWTAGPSPAALCEEIARYILGFRLQLADADIRVLGRSFARLLPSGSGAVPASALFSQAREAFATLENDIRGLEDLPLHVRQIAPVDAALRSATIRPPAVNAGPKAALHPMEVVLYFEASGKWPDNLAAIQRAKIAFLQRIGESLEAAKLRQAGSGHGGGGRGGGNSNDRDVLVETHIGLEEHAADASSSSSSRFGEENLAFLDIVYRGVAAFRLRIHSDLEEAILVRQTREKTRAQPLRAASAHRLAALRRQFGHLPLQNQTITTFCTRFPALSPTIRLVKRWFAAHKLAGHVTDEFLELVVLHVFLRPAPWTTPASATPGLLRTLQFLARWDWRTEPLVVDTSSMSNTVPGAHEHGGDGATALLLSAASDVMAAGSGSGDNGSSSNDPRTRLEAWRKIDPVMNHTVLFVAATHDTSGTAFTTAAGRPVPSKVVAARMTSLARAACRLVKETDVSSVSGVAAAAAAADLDAKRLFQPSLGDYDVLIHLCAWVVKQLVKGDWAEEADGADGPHARRALSVYKNLDSRTGRDLHPLAAHPVQLLLDQLNTVYGGTGGVGPLVFFPGDYDEDYVIGAMWNPQVHPRTLRVNMPCSFRPVAAASSKSKKGSEEQQEGEPLLEVDREAILAEIARIGGSMIEKIEVNRPQKK